MQKNPDFKMQQLVLIFHSKIDLQSKKRLVNNSLNSKTGLPAPGQYNNYGLGSRSVYDLWTG